MKIRSLFLSSLLCSILFTSCSDDMDDSIDDDVVTNPENVEIRDFIYRGMNEIYLYKSGIPELADNYFDNNDDYEDYLRSIASPEALFDSLTIPLDRFSFLTDDYIELENSFSGISQTTGVDYILYRFSNSNNLFGVVRYIIPGSNAEGTAIARGDLFTEVNGESLNVDNYTSLLSSPSVTFTIAEINDNEVSNTGEEVTIATTEITENPILIQDVLEVDGKKIGYLMYNSFVADFDAELNDAFAYFKSENIDDLVLDLRYNGGGRVSSATRLASMITGSNTGEIFAKQQWNDSYQNYFLATNPDRLFDYFTDNIDDNVAINKLNLANLYVIGTSSTASASELVINGLKPYINVVTIGARTTGKSQASVTLYDSEDFSRQNASPNHTYAIQPLVYESVNANDIVVPYTGIDPDVQIAEELDNFGILGDPSEPLLAAAIAKITGNSQAQSFAAKKMKINYQEFKERGASKPDYKRMYIDKVPGIRINN
ncbi:S41 family peptidase [Zunongwangia endophytica]|uniref:S41 family peptidase n=1 Tax=Zunongwangia endophytica TaxID=1808945 RepID=A0ABV8HAF4_9FLAO|nr:S41 family peptidase [Zunongwangia endophytica]MDN3593877.1 S41 family peptidase [Zunongwangia endophytica]